MPPTTTQAIKRTDDNFSAWSDFKEWMDICYANALKMGNDAVRSVDPDAYVGIGGGQLPHRVLQRLECGDGPDRASLVGDGMSRVSRGERVGDGVDDRGQGVSVVPEVRVRVAAGHVQDIGDPDDCAM